MHTVIVVRWHWAGKVRVLGTGTMSTLRGRTLNPVWIRHGNRQPQYDSLGAFVLMVTRWISHSSELNLSQRDLMKGESPWIFVPVLKLKMPPCTYVYVYIYLQKEINYLTSHSQMLYTEGMYIYNYTFCIQILRMQVSPVKTSKLISKMENQILEVSNVELWNLFLFHCLTNWET